MARYLLTGAAGFIASRVAELLVEQGHTVVGVDNMNDAYDVRMKEYRLQRLQSLPNFNFHRLDISDRSSVDSLEYAYGVKDAGPVFSAVINLAARAGVRQSVENPWVYLDTNITGTLNLLEFCKRNAVPKFVLASTSSVYGDDAPLPTPEDTPSDHPLQAYAASKKSAEALCHVYHYLNGLDVTIFRYFTVYGPAGRPDMSMFRFTRWISEGQALRLNGDGEQRRGFTYVDDIANGTVLGLRPLGYEIINLGGHEMVKINQVIEMLEELIGQKARVVTQPAHPADMLANWADVQKAGRLLGWEPRVSLLEGMTRMVAWYNEERSWASQIDTG